MLQDDNPDAECMDEIHRKDGEKKQYSTVSYSDRNYKLLLYSTGKSFAHHTSAVWWQQYLYLSVGRAYFDLFARHDNSACWILLDMCWLSPNLLVCAVALWSARLTCFAALCGLFALCCAVLCCAVLYCARGTAIHLMLSACLCCRTLVGTYLICGFVRADYADCAGLWCTCGGTVIQ